MATVSQNPAPETEELELENGDRMTQPEFHRLYSKTGGNFKAELIGGIVYVASPLKVRHGRNHLPLGTLFFLYEGRSPGVECCDNTTIVLGPDSEPQPDLLLRILPEFGGRTNTTPDDYISGPPELVAEIASSTHSIDLHDKRDEYAQQGVFEYLVLSVRDQRLHWFDLRTGQEQNPDRDGVFRIKSFPGLWIQGEALVARDSQRLLATLNQGLASSEHAEFVSHLAATRKP